MVRSILIATDGSAVSNKTACAGVDFAAQLRAAILALYVAPDDHYPAFIEIVPPSYPSDAEYRAAMVRTGDGYLAGIHAAAARHGLACTGLTAFADSPGPKIVEVAAQRGCDLMAAAVDGEAGGARQAG